jgi:hypothetical protein
MRRREGDARTDFILWEHRVKKHRGQYLKHRTAINERNANRLHALAMRKGYRGKKELWPCRGIASKMPQLHSEFCESIKGEVEGLRDSYLHTLRVLEGRGAKLVKACKVKCPEGISFNPDLGSITIDTSKGSTAEAWQVFEESYHSTYHSQTAPQSYSRLAIAELQWLVSHVAPHVPYEIVSDTTKHSLWVAVSSKLDMRILRAKIKYCDTFEMGEVVRRTLALGLNPRVLHPHLPTGFEDALGISQTGNRSGCDWWCPKCQTVFEACEVGCMYCKCGGNLEAVERAITQRASGG